MLEGWQEGETQYDFDTDRFRDTFKQLIFVVGQLPI